MTHLLFGSGITFLADSSIVDVPENIWDKLVYGLKFSLTGIIVVFLILAILMIVIKLFELFFYRIPNARKKKKEEQLSKENVLPESSPDSEIAAVIAAAVNAYLSEEGSGPRKKYRIKSYRRI